MLNRIYGLYANQHADGQVMLDTGHAGRQEYLAREPGSKFTALEGWLVFQKSTSFPMSIYDNIALAITPYTELPRRDLDARIETALRRAAIWDEVKDVLATRDYVSGSFG